MTRAHNPDDICAMCNEYSVKAADPAYAAIGMGRCPVCEAGGYTAVHVAWDSTTCVSYRLDKPNLSVRRQYVAMWRNKEEANG